MYALKKLLLKQLTIRLAMLLVLGLGLFLGGYLTNRTSTSNRPQSTNQASRQDKTYYVSFDNYYYEVPKQKAVDDRLVPGGQFLYNLNTGIKANTLDDLFNDGAIGVQALAPLNGEDQAFERYLNTTVKASAANAFAGTADLSFSDRKDGIKAADLVSKKNGQAVRRQYMINLPQSVAVVTKDDSEAFRAIGRTVGQASAKFSDYESMKLQVLAESFMLRNRLFEDMYQLAHGDLRGATSVDELNRIADRSKEIFNLEAKVSGVKLSKDEMTATVHFIDSSNPAKTKIGTLTFRQSDGKWKLFTLNLPNGSVSGAAPDQNSQTAPLGVPQ